MGHHLRAGPRATRHAEIERRDVEARRDVGRIRRHLFGLAHHVHLQSGHVAERDRAPGQHGQHDQPGIRGSESEHQQHRRQQSEDDLERADRAPAIGQATTPDIADGDGNAVRKQYQPDHLRPEAGDVLEDGSEEGESDQRAAIADRGHRVDQQQARLQQYVELPAQRRGCGMRDVLRYKQLRADHRHHAKYRDRQERGAPAEVLADEGA